MFKSKLQVLCQQNSWDLPEYSTTRDGPDHNPRFTATVTVEGLHFQPSDLSRTTKEAQNKAAKLALDHFSAPNALLYPSPSQSSPLSLVPNLPISTSSSGVSPSVMPVDIKPSTEGTLQPNTIEPMAIPLMNETEMGVKDDKVLIDVRHLYKNRLQTYAQKRNLTLPAYSCDREGPPHASRFKSKVTIAGKTYESPGFFSTIKEADHAAAKVALESLSLNEVQEDDSTLYKNLLQELAQKEGWNVPKYETTVSGLSHMPTFFSIVEIKGQSFQGQGARNKKQAEMSAAKVAYTNLQERQKNKDEESFSCSESLPVQTPGYKNKDEEMIACSEPLPVRMPDRGGRIPVLLPPACQIKEALKESSSILQSVITGDLWQNARLKSNLISEEQEDKCTDGNAEKFSSKLFRVNTKVGTSHAIEEKIMPKMKTTVDAEVGAHIAPIQPCEADVNAKRYRCSSSSDIGYAHLRDPFPLTSSPTEDGISSSSMRSECSANSHTGSNNEPPVCGAISQLWRKFWFILARRN